VPIVLPEIEARVKVLEYRTHEVVEVKSVAVLSTLAEPPEPKFCESLSLIVVAALLFSQNENVTV
jgi:hypothetical protein